MNLLKSKLSVAIAIGLLGGSTHAANIDCKITPVNSIITEGQTLQLAANCPGVTLSAINWTMDFINGVVDPKSVTGDVDLVGHQPGESIFYSTPVGLSSSGSGDFRFTATGVSAGNVLSFNEAQVIVQPASAVLAAAAGAIAPTSKVNALCGSAGAINAPAVAVMPKGTLACDSGKQTLAISGPEYFSWSCVSLTGGTESNCFALNSAAPAPSAPSAPATVNGTCGTAINDSFSSAPTTNLCGTTYGNTSVVTGSTYTWNCKGSDNTVTTDDKSCSATIISSGGGSGGSGGDTGIGSGLWVPPGMSNRTVADQSSSSMVASYVPGCLNDQFAKDSNSGCAISSSYTGLINNVSHPVTLGSGKELVLRYKTPASVTNGKTIKVGAWNGGNVGVNMRIWLSTSPTETYASASQYCKSSSKANPTITTGNATSVITSSVLFGKTIESTKYYCKLDQNTVYYFGIEFTEAVSGSAARFQVDEMSADFLP